MESYSIKNIIVWNNFEEVPQFFFVIQGSHMSSKKVSTESFLISILYFPRQSLFKNKKMKDLLIFKVYVIGHLAVNFLSAILIALISCWRRSISFNVVQISYRQMFIIEKLLW